MKKTVTYVMFLTIISKFLGFGREIVLSYFYGTSSISDAYLISTTIPFTLFAAIGAGISTTYIPMFSNISKKENIESANRFTNKLISILMIICTLIVIVSIIAAPNIVKLFASGFDDETLRLSVNFTQISVFSIYFSGLVFIYSGFLQINNNYLVPALIGVPSNIIILLSIYLSTKMGLTHMSIGIVLAFASQLILLLPFILKCGHKFSFVIDFADNNIKRVFMLSLPAILGTSVEQINKLIDRTIASQISMGGISALTYASRLNWVVQGIFIMSIVTVIFPQFTNNVAESNIDKLKKTLKDSIIGILLLVLPATIGAMIFAKPIVMLLFGRGEFGTDAINMTSTALFFYSIGMLGFGLREVLSRVFFAYRDTKTPMINAAIGMVLNIILNVILSRYLGIGGLALATSISALFTTLLMMVSLKVKIGSLEITGLISTFIKIIIASLIMGVLSKSIFEQIRVVFNQDYSLLISILIGAICYVMIIAFMKISEFDLFVNIIRQRVCKNKIYKK